MCWYCGHVYRDRPQSPLPTGGAPPGVVAGRSVTRKRTVADLSELPPRAIEALRRVLRGETLVSVDETLEIERSWPHGHVAAVLGTLRRIGLERVLASHRSPERDRVVGMIVARILNPDSKLATARGLGTATSSSTLASELALDDVNADAL